MITATQLRAIMPASGGRAAVYAGPLSDAMAEFGIGTRLRQAAFLAQVAQESGQLHYTREIWGDPPTRWQQRYERDFGHHWPPLMADPYNRVAFELGNTEPGDGYLCRGMGLIQVTGRTNITSASLALFGDYRLLTDPHAGEDAATACRLSGWFWRARGMAAPADRGDIDAVTRIVNPAGLGGAERREFYRRALAVLI